jgi:nicotinate-nucleotide adenylyltransferase
MTRLGLLGGTFDPIHLGHLDVAEAARQALGLDRILLVPAAVPPHRGAPVASAAHRFAMVALAAQQAPHLCVSDLEMGDHAPSYTAATLARLESQGAYMSQLVVLAGADAFAEIATWRDYPTLLDRCHFAVVSRPGHRASALRSSMPGLAPRMALAERDLPVHPTILLVDAETAPGSSTAIRKRAAAGESLEGLVPPAVAAYIDTHGLYSGCALKGLG